MGNGPGFILLAILGAVALLCGVGTTAYRRAKSSARIMVDAMQSIKEELAETPKSLNAMTAVYLPAIEKDFPSFNLFAFIPRAEDMLRSALRAIDAKDIDLLVNASESLQRQVEEHIRALGEDAETYRDIRVHRTVIANYSKRSGNCVIVLQSAVEYHNGKTKVQTRYNIDLVYVQDLSLLSAGEQDKSVGVVCPKCGAPVRSLGQASCEYCGAGIMPLSIYAWKLNRFHEL